MVKNFQDVQYTLTEDGWLVEQGLDKDMIELDIPSEIDGHPVVQVECSAFRGFENLESVWLPASIEVVDSYAFSDCISLNAFNCESKDLTIERSAFDGCKNLKYFRAEGKVYLSSRAFSGCVNLEEFRGVIESVGEKTFRKCCSLTQPLQFADKMYYFYLNAFENCSVKELHFEGDLPKDASLKKDDGAFIHNMCWHCLPNSNIVDLAYQGFNVCVKE